MSIAAPARRISDRNIFLIYAAILLLGIAYGVAISLLPLYLNAQGYGKESLGSLGSWFAAGIAALSFPAGASIRRFGARATLIACLLGYAVAVSALPLCQGYTPMAVVRFIDGAFSVGVWVSCETILLARADAINKALVTSIYAISLALGYVIGPLLAKALVLVIPMSSAFYVSGAIAFVTSLLVLARLDPDPRNATASTTEAIASTTPGALVFWRIKTSCFATFSYGYFQASVVLFLPLYLMNEKGIEEHQTLIVPAFFAGGMLVFAMFAGRLGDRYGHLLVMRTMAAVGTAMILGFIYLDAFRVMLVAVFIAGATLASISPVSLALQGVVTDKSDLHRANAFYNAFYAAGMLVGPLISGRIFAAKSGVAMLFHFAAIWTVFVLFTIVFRKDDPRARTASSSV